MVWIVRGIVIRDVATRASIWSVIIIPLVTGRTIVCDRCMCSIQYIVIIVYWEGRRLPVRSRSVAHFTIQWKSKGAVVWIGGSVEIGCMASGTGVWRIGVISLVTGITIIGDGKVRPAEWIDSIVVKGRGRPGSFAMTSSAIGWELRGDVIWAGGRVVIGCVTAFTGVRCIGVIASVATGTIAGYHCVRSLEGVIIVMYWEGSRCPPGICGMAHRTIRRQV